MAAMFHWLKPKSPLTDEQRVWLLDLYDDLSRIFSIDENDRAVITPSDKYFPDPYTGTLESLNVLFQRVSQYFGMTSVSLELHVYYENAADQVAAAFDPALHVNYRRGAVIPDGEKYLVYVEGSHVENPELLVAVMVRQMITINLVVQDCSFETDAQAEVASDILAVAMGFGIFAANSSLLTEQWSEGKFHGWSMSRTSQLSLAEFAFALAYFSHRRGEYLPEWMRYLRPDIKSIFKLETKWLKEWSKKRVVYSSHLDSSSSNVANHTNQNMETWSRRPVTEYETITGSEEIPDPENPHEVNSLNEQHGDNEADLLFARGVFLADQGDYHEALDVLTRSLELNQDDAEIWWKRGEIYSVLEDYPSASEDLTKALEIDAENEEVRIKRAYVYAWLGKYPEAKEDAARSIKSNPQNPWAHYIHGLCLLILKQHAEASRSLDLAIQHDPTLAELYLARSRIMTLLGKTERAQRDLAQALKRNPRLSDPQVLNKTLASRVLDS